MSRHGGRARASSTLADDAGDRGQHGPFGVLVSHPKLQRHGALVVLSERHVHMGGRPGIAERVLHSRDDADHPDGLPDFWSLGVEELNQPSECVLSRPETLRERVVDDRDPLRGAGCQFGVAEIPAAKHGQSEDSRVVAADDAEHGANRSRLRIGGAGRSHVATVAHSRKRKTRSDGHGFHARDRSQPIHQREMRLSPSRFVVPARLGSTSTSNPPSRRNPGSAVAAESALIRNSPPDASRSSESATWPITRALPILPPPDRPRPSSRTCRLRSVATARPVNAQAGHAPKTSVATRLNPTVPTSTRQSRSSSGRLKATGSTGRSDASSALGRPRRQQQPDRASGQREEQPFGEQLPSEAPSAATERRPDGHLLPAHVTARQQQIDEVEAGHEQDDRRHDHQEQGETRSDRATSGTWHEHETRRLRHLERVAGVDRRKRLLESTGNGGERRRDALDRGASPEPPHNGQLVRLARIERRARPAWLPCRTDRARRAAARLLVRGCSSPRIPPAPHRRR